MEQKEKTREDNKKTRKKKTGQQRKTQKSKTHTYVRYTALSGNVIPFGFTKWRPTRFLHSRTKWYNINITTTQDEDNAGRTNQRSTCQAWWALPGKVHVYPPNGGHKQTNRRGHLRVAISTRTWSFGIRSGRHAHAPGSSSASCRCCNGSVGLNRNTTCIWYVEVWELKLYFYPSAGG